MNEYLNQFKGKTNNEKILAGARKLFDLNPSVTNDHTRRFTYFLVI